jgi:hypothetical protein
MSPDRRAALLTAGIPALFSLALSLAMMGGGPHWQDEGFYLSAIKDLTVLYPHGFVLYQFSAWVWTRLLFFVDFTRAVHLYSAVCVASACGVLALATRESLRKPEAGPEEDAWDLPGRVAAGVGCLAASGFTMSSAGIAAKGYALYYLVLSLLLWVLARLDRRPNPRDWTAAALLIGLAWAAHPSAALIGLALLAFVAVRGRTLGGQGIAWRAGLAALAAAGPPLLLLPWMASKESLASFGQPSGGAALLEYFTGGRFTGRSAFWGLDPVRAARMLAVAWEEFLGVGLLLAGLGGAAWVRERSPRAAFAALWIVPFTAVTLLFRIEGQMDFWCVAAWLPAVPAMGRGLLGLARRVPERPTGVAFGLTALGVVWALGVNYRDVERRHYDLDEKFVRHHLEFLEPNAVLMTSRDDTSAALRWAQTVQGRRPDVLVFVAEHLGTLAGDRFWFAEALFRQRPELIPVDVRQVLSGAPPGTGLQVLIREFIRLNVACGRPLYLVGMSGPPLAPPGWEAVPVGALWRFAPAGALRPETRHFDFEQEPEDLRRTFRRLRGIEVFLPPGGAPRIYFEPYERRLATLLLQARQNLAEWHLRHANPLASVRLLESILAYDPERPRNPLTVHLLALCRMAAGNAEGARSLFLEALAGSRDPSLRGVTHVALGDIARQAGDEEEARRQYQEAARYVEAAPGLKSELESRGKPR